MQLDELHPKHKAKRKKRIGRGGKHGTYSGRGIKGQKARAGRKLEPIIRQLIKRYPKLRGYRQKTKEKVVRAVNLSVLEKEFKSEDRISPKILIARKIIRKIKGRVPEVKILAKGELKKKLTIQDCKVSRGAREKIERAGGTIEMKSEK